VNNWFPIHTVEPSQATQWEHQRDAKSTEPCQRHLRVCTFLFFWRGFFALDVTFVFIRVSGATFFIWRDLVYLARLFFLATESNRFPSSP